MPRPTVPTPAEFSEAISSKTVRRSYTASQGLERSLAVRAQSGGATAGAQGVRSAGDMAGDGRMRFPTPSNYCQRLRTTACGLCEGAERLLLAGHELADLIILELGGLSNLDRFGGRIGEHRFQQADPFLV